ncbi:uncharacterized protein LOC111688549 [Lucilia cuprina]|uniref:uncharacterized protein LOC111688549 n=1 Tax=Lucilia cuprina TaxID=7375 RepID=UPI001F065BB4|nr:uncharacterized protein LOC111688549 [Lucilia cuprina]
MGCITSTNKQLYTFKRDDIFNVSVVRVQSDQSVVLASQGFLEITPHELIFIAPEQEPVAWALQHLRRYGLTGNIFSFEAGRRCTTGPGIYTFRCCNADQFYIKFQRYINSMSVVADRSNTSIHPSHIFGRFDSQPHTNHYLEPTSVQAVASTDDRTILTEAFSNESNDFNLNSPDSMQSASLTAEIIHFPTSVPSYSNVSPNAHCSSNIYMEQPIKVNNEHNNNISTNEITDPTTKSSHITTLNPLFKSSSLDIPPDECAPILNTNFAETQRLYENIDSSVAKSARISQNICNNLSERCYANVDLLPRLDVSHIGQSKSFQTDLAMEQQATTTNNPIVNYIILDLDQPRSPSQCSPKSAFGSGQSLSGSGCNVSSLQKEDLSSITPTISCGSSTMPKGSTITENSFNLPNNRMESSGSYTRIDFLKTFALMKSSTNYTDFDIDNDQEESRITRHSKFVRKAYSISE